MQSLIRAILFYLTLALIANVSSLSPTPVTPQPENQHNQLIVASTSIAKAVFNKVQVTEYQTVFESEPEQPTQIDDVNIFYVTSTKYVDSAGRQVSAPMDQSIMTLIKAGIGIVVVVAIALIGIFILRKWKFSPTKKFRNKLSSTEGLRKRTNESDTVFLRELHAP